MGENPPGGVGESLLINCLFGSTQSLNWSVLVIWLNTNPIDDNAKLFHQSLPIEEVVGGDKEIPGGFCK